MLGHLKRDNGKYSNSESVDVYCVKGSPKFMGDFFFTHTVPMMGWADPAKTVKEGNQNLDFAKLYESNPLMSASGFASIMN